MKKEWPAMITVRKEVCFADAKGRYKPGIEKQQVKLVLPLAPLLTKLLEPGEEVLCLSTAASPFGTLEQLTTGWIIFYVKRCVLVFTSKRILHFPTLTDFKPKDSIAVIRPEDVNEWKIKGLTNTTLALKYADGTKERFLALKEGKRIKGFLPQVFSGVRSPEGARRRHVCPACLQPLTPGEYACPKCFLTFKSPANALRWSILLPGGGYFYTGHPIMGLLDGFVEGFFLLLLFAAILGLLGSDAEADPGSAVALVPLIILLTIEKLISVYHAQHYIREYIPASKIRSAERTPIY